jgi:hypothetical protein
LENEEQWQQLKDAKLTWSDQYYGAYCYKINDSTYSSSSTKTDPGIYGNTCKIIQFNQIKFNDMDKEIIRYKLKEDCKQYKQAIEKLVHTTCSASEIENLNTKINTLSITNLQKAGVLELWFEPIYKQEEFKVGNWIIGKNNLSPSVARKVLKITNGRCEYSNNHNDIIQNSCEFHFLRLATTEEIQESLMIEAKKRYPVGTKFKAARGCRSTYTVTSLSDFRIDSENTICIFSEGNGTIYHNGIWAEIIEHRPDITINGHRAEFLSDVVKFGYAYIDKNMFIELAKFLAGNSYIGNKTINSVTIGNGEFTKKQIEEIAEYYLNK